MNENFINESNSVCNNINIIGTVLFVCIHDERETHRLSFELIIGQSQKRKEEILNHFRHVAE